VLAVESGLTGALAVLEWAGNETERRLTAAHQARQLRRPVPDDARRPLWIIVDRPTALGHLTPTEGHGEPQRLLQVPLRHGRAANITVALAEQFDAAGLLAEPVLAHTRARVVLGPATVDEVQAVLGVPPHTTPAPDVPPGRGYARLGTGPVHRLQVPAAPDPYDEEADEAQRQAVLNLLLDPSLAAPAQPGAADPGPLTAQAT
jgi:hypothetical protein